MLAALARRRPVTKPVALVVAHPDDETLAAGGSLHLFRNLLLIHVTDGAPRRLTDAANAGYSSPKAYAQARTDELEAALSHLRKLPSDLIHHITLAIPDQEATAALPTLVATLSTLFTTHVIAQVITHAYEGGHPDHDAVALAVHRTGRPVIEFAGYHARPEGGMRTGRFLHPSHEDVAIALPPEDLAQKRAMLACFRTQAAILAQFDPAIERFRPAPAYDFAAPPHPGRLLYEEWGWMTGSDWRRAALC